MNTNNQIQPEQNNTLESIFGKPISTYSRQQALDDGFQIDVSTTAKEAGIKFPVFLTQSVWESYVAVPENVEGQNEAGRLWDIIWMLRNSISKAQGTELSFKLYVRNDNRRAKLISLIATCEALDIDDPRPAITVMKPGED